MQAPPGSESAASGLTLSTWLRPRLAGSVGLATYDQRDALRGYHTQQGR